MDPNADTYTLNEKMGNRREGRRGDRLGELGGEGNRIEEKMNISKHM